MTDVSQLADRSGPAPEKTSGELSESHGLMEMGDSLSKNSLTNTITLSHGHDDWIFLFK